MEKTKLKRSIFIGLGGTGIKVLRKTKKMFIDQYGEVPPMIQFLGIDTDKNEYEKHEEHSGDKVYLTKAEQCSISVPGNPIDYVNGHKKELSWMPPTNLSMVRSLDVGAGQVRSNGRVAFIYNVTNVRTAIDTAYTKAANFRIVDNARYAVSEGKVQIHVIFSLGGGT